MFEDLAQKAERDIFGAASRPMVNPDKTKHLLDVPGSSNDTKVNQPILYKLNAYSSKAERVNIDGKPIRLPFARDSNQFAFVRPLDPKRSRQMSCLNNLMFAVLK